ncbi:uncharacterized protein O3C94_014114 [Discoglossus pictus]
MGRTPPSADVSYKLKVTVTSLISVSNFFLLLTLVSNYWVYVLVDGTVAHLGVFNVCTALACVGHGGAGYVKAALIVAIIFGLAFNAFAGFQIKYSDLNFRRLIGTGMLSTGIVELYGMVHGSIEFGFHRNSTWGWGYAVGWIAVVLAILAGSLSLYHHWAEPPIPDPTPMPQAPTTTVETPPSAIIVS